MSTPNTHIGYKEIGRIMSLCRNKDIFFLGAGGIMMSSLALITHKLGFSAKGSDRNASALTARLEESGIEMFYSHSKDNLGDNCGALIYTVAVSPENPEYCEAMKRGIPCISRADYLGYIMTEYKNRVGVAGMHGKSSCTSMCAQIFLDAAKNKNSSYPTIISGAEYSSMGGAYYIGEKHNFIFEACEYMDSFLDFNPTVAILLNAEMEHVDYFKSMDHIINSFKEYAMLVGNDGNIIYNIDDSNIVAATESICANKISFGLCDNADFRAVDIRLDTYPIEFDVIHKNQFFAHIKLPSLGKHSVYNALAAIAASYCSGICVSDIVEGLANFKGAKRRMEYKGELMGARVYDDYGHHPTEIEATLYGAKNACCGRLICVFQPHTYSRTAALADKFAGAFASADKVILTDIYAAREVNDFGISSEKLAQMIGDKAIYAGDFDSVKNCLESIASPSDMIVVMGAGDIFKLFSKMGL